MSDVLVIGGGPAGLSAALFTGKNGLETTILDDGSSWMSNAHLFNYLGIGSIDGEAFMKTARAQVDAFGVEQHATSVTTVEQSDGGFTARSSDTSYEATYLVLATGANRDLATELGCAFDDDVVAVDVSMETSVPDAYATGAMVRAEEWQAIISAGDGAAAALNILTKEHDELFHDFDTPTEAEAVAEVLSTQIATK
jgi:thioredoxin reductase